MKSSVLYEGGRCLCRICLTTLFDFKAYGAGNVPAKGGVVLASNHESYMDPVLIAMPLRRPVAFMGKSELFRNRHLAKLYRRLNAFPVNQGQGDIRAMRQMIERMEQGYAVTMFPEGSRTTDGKLAPLEPGVALIARRTGMPVVPVAIHGSFQAWPRTQRLPHPYPIRVMYGQPMTFDHLKAAEVVARIEAALQALLVKVRTITD